MIRNLEEEGRWRYSPHRPLCLLFIMQGICSLIWTNLFLLQNVSLAFDELYLEKLQIVNNVQLGVTLKSGKAVITKSRKLQFVISPQIFCTGSFACWSRVCGHIWNIRQNTFPEPLLSRFKPTHEDSRGWLDYVSGINKFNLKYQLRCQKGLIKSAVAGPREFFKQHLIKNEEQPFFSKRYSAHFGELSTM